MPYLPIDPAIFDQPNPLIDIRAKIAETQTTYLANIDDKLGDLLGADIHPDRISIEKYPGPKTRILVDGQPVYEFTLAITYQGRNTLEGMIL